VVVEEDTCHDTWGCAAPALTRSAEEEEEEEEAEQWSKRRRDTSAHKR
jgi:hypothetical protein